MLHFSNENELIDIIKLLKDGKVNLDKIRVNAKTFNEHFYYKKSVKNILNIIGNDRKLKKLLSKKSIIGIIGLGYVGLPLAGHFLKNLK